MTRNQMKRLTGSAVIGAAVTALILLRPALDGVEVDPWSIVSVVLGGSAVAYQVWSTFDAPWSQWDRKIEPKWVARFAIVAVSNFVLPRALAALTGWSMAVTTFIYILLILFAAIVWLRLRGYRFHQE